VSDEPAPENNDDLLPCAYCQHLLTLITDHWEAHWHDGFSGPVVLGVMPRVDGRGRPLSGAVVRAGSETPRPT